MTERRPSVFIGSSAEGVEIAEAIQLNLDRVCEVVIWSQGLFGLSTGTLETLVERLTDFDFAVLVLTPDDLTESRGVEKQSARDNVLIELGLFIGGLGRERTFAVFDRGANLKVPSDLAGVTLAEYQRHSSGNLQSSLGAASTLIKGRVQELGVRQRGTINTNVDQNTHFQVINDLLDPAARQFIILMFETSITLTRENIFGSGIRYLYGSPRQAGDGFFSVDKLCQQLPDAGLLQCDLRNRVGLTDRGRDFAQWMLERGHKADYFKCDLGNWGNVPAGYRPFFDQPRHGDTNAGEQSGEPEPPITPDLKS
ncbi:TIR domain-containing protein [Neorhodopirellula pilleata]|uniref:Putative nucleotide-binding protein containing TIR-like domain protein n=1 Tax=Neorhodopirellula pilleata TaxID=2714738 RepID=A0A5C5YQH5_9BACT|nr:nucleotide-binding protein [Neorhodopirellula pilleata]TWT77181.1 putative nucleotide-binding protein containing TIR-like domain protein [Neorhodopirellula pilleata]